MAVSTKSVKREPNAQTLLMRKTIDLVINVPDSMDSGGVTDGFYIRFLLSLDRVHPVK